MPKKLTFDFIEKEFNKENYIVLSNKYEGCSRKLSYICPNGHEHSISWANWKQGRRCPYCVGVILPSFNEIKKSFDDTDYKLLSKECKNAKQKLDYICPVGHKHNINWNNWKSGKRCPYCQGCPIITIDDLKKDFESEGYVLLTNKYSGVHSYVKYICPKGHKSSIRVTNWRQGFRCTKCSNNVSVWENSVKKFVSSFYNDIIENDKSQVLHSNTGRYLELDIWMPSIRKAIECNGSYWHSFDDRKILDKYKIQFCRKNNIDLLVVTDKEWKNNNDLCKDKIKLFVKEGNQLCV